MEDKLEKKKVHGVWRLEFSTIRIIKPEFTNAVTTYITRNRKNNGIWTSGWSVNPTKMSAFMNESFVEPIVLLENLCKLEK
jgi:hypothetical protein